MKIIEDREIPVPIEPRLKSVTITLSRDEVKRIKEFGKIGFDGWKISGSSTIVEIVERIQAVEL